MKYTKNQLKEMAITYINSDDQIKKMQLITMMQVFTGLHPQDIERKIKDLARWTNKNGPTKSG